MHWFCLELLYFLAKFHNFLICLEFLDRINALCDIYFGYLKIFSEENNFGGEDQEYCDTPFDQGKPHHPLA